MLILIFVHIRIFTAGDSSDVQIVVDFVSKSRPWTTIMAVGWGYGANMLAKYLGEVELATPVTAAVCINNPFDLEESTRASSDIRAIDLDRYMTNGFIQILKENQVQHTKSDRFS
jgi:predicted alpha/beta-fold hydrolase